MTDTRVYVRWEMDQLIDDDGVFRGRYLGWIVNGPQAVVEGLGEVELREKLLPIARDFIETNDIVSRNRLSQRQAGSQDTGMLLCVNLEN